MQQRKDIDSQAIGLVMLICMIWGFQQVAIKWVAADMSPVLQIAIRSGIAAVLVSLVIFWRRESLAISGVWHLGLLAGVLFALEFLLIGEGLRYTTASHMTVFLYSAPVFAAFTLHWLLPAERLSSIQWSGILLAFAGIAITFLGRDTQATSQSASDMLWGDFLALLAALSWALTTVLIRSTRLAGVPATQLLLYQLIVCFGMLFAYAVVQDQLTVTLSQTLIVNLAFQGVVVSFGSLLIWFWMLRRYPASQLGTFTFMTPLFGIAFGVWLLDDPLDRGFVVGSAMVMGGIVLVNGHQKIRQAARWSPKAIRR